MAVADAAPNSTQAAFIAPNAMIAGDVTLGSGSSAWYGSVLRGKFAKQCNSGIFRTFALPKQHHSIFQIILAGDFGEPTRVGSSSHVHERSVVSSSNIGDNVIIGEHRCFARHPVLKLHRDRPYQ